ncbi:MAG: hypothetical protein AB7N80_04700 [Bdellovibrionales bacterium]
MGFDRSQLEFRDFKPEYETRQLIADLMEGLQSLAPSDSAMNVAFRKGRGVVEATCRIASIAGTFVAKTISDTPIKAMQALDEKIRLQLEDWKKHRFVGDDD